MNGRRLWMKRVKKVNAGPEISALITCYFEEQTIDEFHAQLSAAFKRIGRPYEIIYVNDGSTDGTWTRLKDIFERDPQVSQVIDLFKNSGQPVAATAAICAASGRIFLSMDSDLQLDPADLPRLLAVYDEGYDVVSGYRKERKDSWSRILPSKIANIIMRRASRTDFSDFGCTFKLYNARLIQGFGYGPFHTFNPVNAISKAGRCKEIPVSHAPRKVGKSGWTFKKLWNYQMEQVVLLSEKPFQFTAILALFTGLLFLFRVVLNWIAPFQILPEVSNGLILNALVMLFLILLACLSMIGEFTLRSFVLSRHEPKYIIREALKRDTAAVDTGEEEAS